MESAHLPTSELQRINSLQLKGMRKILAMTTTFIDRANTNERVFEKANAVINASTNRQEKTVENFQAIYQKRKLQLFQRVAAASNADPMRQASLRANTVHPVEYGIRRVGRPRARWATDAARLYWNAVRGNFTDPYYRTTFDANSQVHCDLLANAAHHKMYTA